MEDIFKFGASVPGTDVCECVLVGTDEYISHCKCQVKPHSSPWFSAACATAIAHRNHFFHLYQQIKLFTYEVIFRKASNHCERVFEAAKLGYANETKNLLLPRNLALATFGELLGVLTTKTNLLYILYLTDLRCCLQLLINCLLKTILKIRTLMISRTNIKLRNIHVPAK